MLATKGWDGGKIYGGRRIQRAHLGGIHDDDFVAADEVGLQSRLVLADEEARNRGGKTANDLRTVETWKIKNKVLS